MADGAARTASNGRYRAELIAGTCVRFEHLQGCDAKVKCFVQDGGAGEAGAPPMVAAAPPRLASSVSGISSASALLAAAPVDHTQVTA